MRASRWLPPVAWMALILWLGSDSGSAERTGRFLMPALRFLVPSASPLQLDALHTLIRKLGHVTEYAVLAALWLRALAGVPRLVRSRVALCAWAIAVAWAVLDESLQSMVASRTGSLYDVMIDALGALVPAMLLGEGWRRRVDGLTRLALWVAAIGGAVMIVVNVMTDVGSGLLWLTVPAAALALFVRRQARR